MKKIISALAVGALVAGGAFAELKVSLNYRNGAELFKYVNNGMDGRTTDDYGNVYDGSGYNNAGATMTAANLTGWNAGKDNLGLQVIGDIFTVKATLQSTIASDVLIWHVFDAGVNVGKFFANTGWNGDGIMNYRVKAAADSGNEEGKVFETYKLGSIFTGSLGLCSTNQISFNTDKNYFARTGYDFRLGKIAGKKVSMKVTGSLMFDRNWDTGSEMRDGNLGWSVFLDPKVLGLFDAEVFVKSKLSGKAGTDKVAQYVTGAYFKPYFANLVGDSAIGGSVVIIDGNLMEYNADWRFRFDVSKELTVTYFGKFAKLVSDDKTGYSPCDGAAVGALAGLTGFSSSQALWNMISARYVINNRCTGVLTIGELTDLDDGFNSGRESADGTQAFVHPHVQIYANGGSSITVGVLAGFGGIGANTDANKDMDILVNIPVLMRVKL